MLLSKQFRDFVVELRAHPIPLDQLIDVADVRMTFDALGGPDENPLDVSVTRVNAGGVPAEWIDVAGGDASHVIVYLHGGAYVAGRPAIYRSFVTALCRAANCRALVIDYRLAPEHPFPASLEDAQRCYAWLLQQGVTAENMVIVGDSAGGGLALSTLVSLRDGGHSLPMAGVLLSPWTDLTLQSDSHVTKIGEDPILTRLFLEKSREHYLGEHDNASNPLVSPLYANLVGLPPLLVLVGTAEILLDDSVLLAQKAREAKVEVDLIRGEDMIHTWPFFISAFPEALEAVQRIGKYIHHKFQ
ncbi:alpha/beta hydrolase [Dickeya dadantii]|nr:alpha/beta hydrolase [Dickeya dadantii]